MQRSIAVEKLQHGDNYMHNSVNFRYQSTTQSTIKPAVSLGLRRFAQELLSNCVMVVVSAAKTQTARCRRDAYTR